MTAVHLWDGYGGGWNTANPLATVAQGVRFTVGADTALGRLGYYALGAGSSYAPSTMKLYRADTSALVAQVTSPTVPTGAGWYFDIPTSSYTLAAGVDYRVVAVYTNGTHQAYVTGAPTGSAPSPLTRASPFGCYAGSDAYPDTTTSSYAWAVDVEVDNGVAGGGGSTLTASDLDAIDGRTATWESASSGTNTHQDALPWQTYQDTQSLISKIGTVSAGEMTTYGISGTGLWRGLVAILGYVVANGQNINGLTSALNTVKNWFGGNGSAPSDWDFYGQVQDISTKVYAIEAKLDTMLAPPPPASWVSQGTHTFDTNLAWAQPADVYTVTYSGLGSNIVNLSVGAADVSYRLAWWAVWDGERMRDRRFADGTMPVLWDHGARMPGIVLHCPGGATGTVEAWLLT